MKEKEIINFYMSKFESLSANIYDEIEAGFLLYILTNPERSQVEVSCNRTAEEKLIDDTQLARYNGEGCFECLTRNPVSKLETYLKAK